MIGHESVNLGVAIFELNGRLISSGSWSIYLTTISDTSAM
jgi:hypothetical protein